ncbi:hypothetical protein I316_02816 [Kwoniella heveanensis BCC8398]|uniref:F-box domain-containing protein n=1 Tax=Kwoniella heveanensis BCC8398 TaxID=1296120 RepID=A0A1B9GW61_9TREE|nr:hypothetical protein I316_02816 [Kwoniella heveanensis BCC8398]
MSAQRSRTSTGLPTTKAQHRTSVKKVIKKVTDGSLQVLIPGKPLPPLPDEIWLEIFKLVQALSAQDNVKLKITIRPAIGQTHPLTGLPVSYGAVIPNEMADTSCLVPLMQVSNRFHDLLSPIVYRHAKFSSPAKFFYAIDYTPAGNNRLTKIDKLRSVESIELVWPNSTRATASRRPYGISPIDHAVFGSCYRALESTLIGINILKRYRDLLELEAGIGANCNKQAQLLFPGLERIHFGLTTSQTSGRLHRGHEIGKVFMAELRRVASPRHVCQHTILPPYNYLANSQNCSADRKGAQPVTYTAPVGQWNRRYKIAVPVLVGSTTRLMIDPRTIQQFVHTRIPFLAPNEQALAIHKFMRWFRKTLARSVGQVLTNAGQNPGHKTGTRIVIYLPCVIDRLRRSLRLLRPEQPDPARLTEAQIMESLSQYLRGSNAWKERCRGVKVDVNLWSQAGECPGCGRFWATT